MNDLEKMQNAYHAAMIKNDSCLTQAIEVVESFNEEQIMKDIDKALDNNDQERFIELTNKLKSLTK